MLRHLGRTMAIAVVVNSLSVSAAQAACSDPPAPGVDWTRCDKSQSNLASAKLKGAKLEFANLQNANLAGADLENAYLPEASLQWSNFQGANLRGAVIVSSFRSFLAAHILQALA